MPSEITITPGNAFETLDKLRAEKASLEEQLRAARDERARLQRDISDIYQKAESSWSTERTENALLRERINTIAAEIASLALTLEGPNSPIEAILAADSARPGTHAKEPAVTLAERIRALQTHTSRARQTG